MSSNRSSVPTRTSGADRFGAVPPIVFWPVYTYGDIDNRIHCSISTQKFTGSRFRVERTGRRRAGWAGCSGAAARPPDGAQSVESSYPSLSEQRRVGSREG